MDPEYSLQDLVRCHLCDSPTPPYTVSIVIYIFVKIARGNIFLMNPTNTKWCHSNIGDLFLNVKNI